MSNRSPTPTPSIDTTPAGVDSTVKVRRGRVDCVTLYEVSESELDQLEAGSPATLQLNFAIFCFSMAMTSGTSLLTANFKSDKWMIAFMVATIVGAILGAFFSVAWFRNRNSVQKIIQRIRQRVQTEPATAAMVNIESDEHRLSANVALVHTSDSNAVVNAPQVSSQLPSKDRSGPPVRPSNPPRHKYL